jgi:hypothetical protein
MAKPARDEESNAIIYRGANVTELAALFGMERRDVQAKIYGIPQAGERNGVPIWRVRDVAPHLAKLNDADLVARVLRMNHADLPPMLKKEFWTGAIQREKYLAMTGHLWPTDQVIQFASTAFKTLRMQLALLQDNVEREAVFSEEQRAVLKRLVDGTMDEARARLVDDFEALRPAETAEEAAAKAAQQVETEDDDELWNLD